MVPSRSHPPPGWKWIALPIMACAVVLVLTGALMFDKVWRPGLLAELGIVTYVSWLGMRFQRRPRRAAVLCTILLLAFYGACLAKWVVLHDAFTPYDVRSVDEVVWILPGVWRLTVAIAVLAFGLGVMTNLAWPGVRTAALLLLPLTAATGMIVAAPEQMRTILRVVRPEIPWNPPAETWRHGPLFTLARQLTNAVIVRRLLAQPVRTAALGAVRPAVLAQLPPPRRNVHLIHLESFADPRSFRAVAFPFDPLDARLRRWLDESRSATLSPTFGGETARAEFEILCGVPSYALLGVEFPTLSGAPMPCLPQLLRQYGYTTLASGTSPRSFFRIERAYPAVGFAESYFETDFDHDDMDGVRPSTAALIRQTQPRLDRALARGRPIFNYVVTWSGHLPMELNPVTRPAVFAGDSWPVKVANVAYYSSKTVADFVEAIETRDPNALIVAYGDHLPPLGVLHEGFREGGYQFISAGSEFWQRRDVDALDAHATPLIIRLAKRTVPVGIVPQFLVPEIILDLLTDGGYCRTAPCLSTASLIYRPLRARPVFTTAAAFPEPICERPAATDDERCVGAAKLHESLYAAYIAMLSEGLQPAPADEDVPDAQEAR